MHRIMLVLYASSRPKRMRRSGKFSSSSSRSAICCKVGNNTPPPRRANPSAIEMERHTVADLSTSLARLQTSLNKVKEASANFDGETAAVRTEVLAERATKERQGKVLHENRSLDETELSAMERALGLSIAGVGGGS